MTRDPSRPRPDGAAEGGDDEVTRVGARKPVRPELSTSALAHLDEALGFGSLDEPATELRPAVGDPDGAHNADIAPSPAAAPDGTSAHPMLMRPVSRAGGRPGSGVVDGGGDDRRALPDADLGRPRGAGPSVRQRPGSAPRTPSRPGLARPAGSEATRPHPTAPPEGASASALGGLAAAARSPTPSPRDGRRSRRDPTDPELRPASLTADETGAARTVVVRRSTDPAVASPSPSRPWLDDAPLDAFAPGARREDTDPSGRPAFIDREPTDPGVTDAAAPSAEERDVQVMRGPASRRNRRVQTAPLGVARAPAAGDVATPKGAKAESRSERSATEAAAAARGRATTMLDDGPPRGVAAGTRGDREPAPAAAAPRAPTGVSPGSGLHPGAAARPAPALPSRHRTTAPGLGAPVSREEARPRRPEVTTEVEPRPPARERGSSGDPRGVGGARAVVASAAAVPTRRRVVDDATSPSPTTPSSPSAQPVAALRALSIFAMVLLFAALALPTASGPPWQHIADPGSVTFVALAFLLLAAVAHLVPARPTVQAAVTVGVGLLMAAFAVVLGRGAAAVDLFDGQPAMVAVLGAPIGAQLVILACALTLPLGLLWRGAAPRALGPRVTIGVGVALALVAYLALGAFGVGDGPAVVGAVDAMRGSPFLGDRLVASLGLAPLLVAVVGALSLHPQAAPRAATMTAVGLWLAMAVPMVLAGLFVATSDAWMAVLEPLKLSVFLAVSLIYLPMAATALVVAVSRPPQR